jgi:hypothetical protein
MALPSKVKTWLYANNLNPNVLGTDTRSTGSTAIAVKDALVGFAGGFWTVAGSSDSVAAGMDAVDRWVDYTDIVIGGGAHSWTVLQNSVLGNTQLCIDFNSGDGRQATIVWSPADGFTGGSTGARPTATDEQSFGVIDIFWNTNTGGFGFNNRAHVQMSNDGECTRIFFCCTREVRSWILIDKPRLSPTGWTNPTICIVKGFAGSSFPQENMTYAHWRQDRYVHALGPMGSMPMFMAFKGVATDGTDGTAIVGTDGWPNRNEIDDDDDPQYPMSHIGLLSRFNEGTVGQRGWMGQIVDMYCTARAISNGNSFPSDGTKTWINFGQFAFPWNGDDIEIP